MYFYFKSRIVYYNHTIIIIINDKNKYDLISLLGDPGMEFTKHFLICLQICDYLIQISIFHNLFIFINYYKIFPYSSIYFILFSLFFMLEDFFFRINIIKFEKKLVKWCICQKVEMVSGQWKCCDLRAIHNSPTRAGDVDACKTLSHIFKKCLLKILT